MYESADILKVYELHESVARLANRVGTLQIMGGELVRRPFEADGLYEITSNGTPCLSFTENIASLGEGTVVVVAARAARSLCADATHVTVQCVPAFTNEHSTVKYSSTALTLIGEGPYCARYAVIGGFGEDVGVPVCTVSRIPTEFNQSVINPLERYAHPVTENQISALRLLMAAVRRKHAP